MLKGHSIRAARAPFAASSLLMGRSSRTRDVHVKCSRCANLLPPKFYRGPVNNLLSKTKSAICRLCERHCRICTRAITLDELRGDTLRSYQQYLSTSRDEPHHQNQTTLGSDDTVCENCTLRQIHARENVYFRYPQLKYQWSPLNVDSLRNKITTLPSTPIVFREPSDSPQLPGSKPPPHER